MELALSIVLTPIIIILWAKFFPVAENDEFNFLSQDTLKEKNKWINNISVFLHFVGLVLPIPLISKVSENNPELVPWGIALIFGSMVLIPLIFVSMVTLPRGVKRFREYWRFYELHYGIGIKGIKVVFIPIGLVGLLSLFKVANAI
ncbi:hypothetical protein CGK45_22995 [Vibrio parahaemolyticus]|uniref:hypothetical protein n=1 Tax=Vibrio parahaemolyticus TaxID=670 RepID=UPI001121E592|nr:hypothetical protein [Vibrio parahaemolyticus]TNZ55559.1 hypothetical protein CGK45_22995 [Vibrio parahaemolyticus]